MESEQCPVDLWSPHGNKYCSFVKRGGKIIHVALWEDEDNLFIEADTDVVDEILYLFWAEYDLESFYSEFTKDPYIRRIIAAAKGLRVMRNLDWKWGIIEALCTQNTSVKRVRRMESCLRRNFGDGYTFNLEKIVKAPISALQKKCGLGYRAKYVKEISKAILNGELDPERIGEMRTEEAREFLLKFSGIGPKVADIILLYTFGRPETFPMDIWLRRALIREYFNGKEKSPLKLRKFALTYFGEHAGIAHLYMFYYERKIRKMDRVGLEPTASSLQGRRHTPRPPALIP